MTGELRGTPDPALYDGTFHDWSSCRVEGPDYQSLPIEMPSDVGALLDMADESGFLTYCATALPNTAHHHANARARRGRP